MHPVPFYLKRSHLMALAMLRDKLAPYGITPARYDLLFVIANSNLWTGKFHRVYQSEIWRALGVCPSVVCKMLRALERLGLVRRARATVNDRRQVIVELTRKARGVLRQVLLRVIRPGVIWLAIYSAFAMSGEDVQNFKGYLDRLRRAFQDRATFLPMVQTHDPPGSFSDNRVAV
jgi:DNA-binding MarR family transcriptional regulator